jgi:antitoxin PrlF
MHTTLTSKGQVTVPMQIRAQLGLKAGSVLDFSAPLEDGAIIVRAVNPQANAAASNRLEALFDCRGANVSIETMNDAIRAIGAVHGNTAPVAQAPRAVRKRARHNTRQKVK